MAKTIRVINACCGCAPESSSGGEVHERELLTELVTLASVHLLIAPTHRVPPALEPFREPLWLARGLRWWAMPFAAVPAIVRCVRRHGSGILRAHSLRFLGPSVILAGRLTGCPTLVHVHHLDGGGLAPLDRWVLRRADAITTDSVFSSGQVGRVVQPRRAIHAIPCGVGKAFRPDAIRAAHSVLFLGGLKPRKNVDFLLRVWQRVERGARGARLWIVGDGPERPALERQAATLGLRTVHFSGFIPDAMKPEIYQRARVFCFPSTLEGFGMPPLEAMACGTPAIVSQEGALPEVVRHGETGYVLPLMTYEWEEVLVRLLTDEALARKMGQAGAEWARQFTWARTARETLAVADRLWASWP